MGLTENVIEIALKKFFEWLGNPFRKKRSTADIMIDSSDVHELARGVVQNGELSVDFLYLMNAFNGKKRDKDHRFKFRKLVAGFHSEWLFKKFAPDDHRKLPVDPQYSEMLERLIRDKIVIFSVWKMDAGHLKDALIHLEFNHMGFYLVDDDDKKNELWYIAVGSKTIEDTEYQTPAHKYVIQTAIDELKIMIDLQRK